MSSSASSSSSSKPWISGRTRQSWCDPKNICDYCHDALYEGNKKKQACRFRPKGLKLSRMTLGFSSRRVVPVTSSRSKEEVKFSHLLTDDGERKYYSTFHRGSLEVKLNDFVYLTAPKDAPHFVAQVLSIFEEDHTPMVTVRWLFRVGETNVTPAAILEKKSEDEKRRLKEEEDDEGGSTIDSSLIIHDRELLISDDCDDNPIASIEDKCFVRYLNPRDATDILRFHAQRPTHSNSNKSNSSPPTPIQVDSSAQKQEDDPLPMLNRLKSLLEQGFMSEAEYNERRLQIIDKWTGTSVGSSSPKSQTSTHHVTSSTSQSSSSSQSSQLAEDSKAPAEWIEFSDFLSKPNHYFYRRWYTTGHFGDFNGVDTKITPYLDNFYENYELLSKPPTDISHILSKIVDSLPKISAGSTAVSSNSTPSKLPPEEEDEEEDGDEYSTPSKGKRKRKGRKKLKTPKSKKQKEEAPQAEEPDLLSLVPCTRFTCKPEIDHPRKQPFYLKVHTNALLLIDLHSHLLETIEVIGFLGGIYLQDSKVLHIKEAFSCAASEESDNMNVEVDPVAEIEISERIKSRGMRVVGWYHSHPLFQPDPSVRDIQSQKSYQQLFKDEDTPNCFVGAIDATYDNRIPTLESIFTWFSSGEENGKDVPFYFSYEIVEDDDIPEELIQKMLELVDEYQTNNDLIDLDSQWKEKPANAIDSESNGGSSSSSRSGSQHDQSHYTIREKMRHSLTSRMPSTWSQEQKLALFSKLVAPIEAKKSKSRKSSR